MELADEIGHVDMEVFLKDGKNSPECKTLAESLIKFGAVLVRDPRVQASDADEFLDMMERYFEQPSEEKMLDARPELYYQVGATPNGVELPRDNSEMIAKLEESEKPRTVDGKRERDPKWRFFWRCGERPSSTEYPELNAAQVVPRKFAGEWGEKMDKWGGLLLGAVTTAAHMLALGLDLGDGEEAGSESERAGGGGGRGGVFVEKMQFGPHLLAPTGSDLGSLAQKVGTTIAGYHYDINLLTIHGRARFPGLHIWTREGRRVAVKVPRDFLLVQSGAQLEMLTGGLIRKGMHEVVVSAETKAHAEEVLREHQEQDQDQAQAQAQRRDGGSDGLSGSKSGKSRRRSRWRVSSTMFAHVRSDAWLDPIEKLVQRHKQQQQQQQQQQGEAKGGKEAQTEYKRQRAGDQIADELRAIKLAQ